MIKWRRSCYHRQCCGWQQRRGSVPQQLGVWEEEDQVAAPVSRHHETAQNNKLTISYTRERGNYKHDMSCEDATETATKEVRGRVARSYQYWGYNLKRIISSSRLIGNHELSATTLARGMRSVLTRDRQAIMVHQRTRISRRCRVLSSWQWLHRQPTSVPKRAQALV